MTRSVAELTCKDVVELVSDYLGRRLPPQESGPLEQHLFMCEPCTLYLEQMKTLVELAGTLDATPAAPQDHAALMDEFRRWKRGAP